MPCYPSKTPPPKVNYICYEKYYFRMLIYSAFTILVFGFLDKISCFRSALKQKPLIII
jgi:hypothetical protein